MIDSITVYACAKINLFLDVLSKLPDGYHEIDTVLQAVSLYDTVTLAPQARGISLFCSDPSLSSFADNLAFRAAALFYQRCPDLHTGVNIQLKKNIPIAAGLAGGSSDAAAVLVGMNLLFGAGLSEDELCSLGERLGMDVPFCVMGGCRHAVGRGEILSPLPVMPKCLILIAVGSEKVSTALAYRQIDSSPASGRQNTVPAALEAGDLRQVCGGMYNRFESITPAADGIKSVMLENGAVAAMMSGSGPSVFGVFAPGDRHSLEKARMRLAAKKYATYVCEPVE